MHAVRWLERGRKPEGSRVEDATYREGRTSAGLAIATLVLGGMYICGWVAGFWTIRFEELLVQAVAVTGGFWIASRVRKKVGVGRAVGGFFPVLAGVLVFRAMVGEPFAIPSASMEPTLVAGDRVWVWKTAYAARVPVLDMAVARTGTPDRGDVVVFRSPMDPRTDWIKRVVGRAGDTVVLTRNELFVNGNKDLRHEEVRGGKEVDFRDRAGSFPNSDLCRMTKESMECTVPRGHLFVAGDNRNNSEDSRRWGFLPEDAVVGKATALWWSGSGPKRVGWIK